jgi:LmbE family N-acetylglucosaminyl deacetylase
MVSLAGAARRRGRPWHSRGNQRVLVVAPHPDDEVAGCGGTIALHRAAGDQVSVLHVTDGRRSRSLGLPPDEVATHRRAEARAAIAVLGISGWEWLGLREGEWADADLAEPLARLLRELEPHTVYLPSRIDFHPEHYRVAKVAGEVLKNATLADRAIRVYQVQVPLTAPLGNVVAAIDGVMPAVRASAACYVSQESSLRGPMRLKRYAARARGVRGYAEEFWEMNATAYVALHAEHPARPLIRTFRGLRRSPLTDPLAFLLGRGERRRLAALVERPRA